MVVPVLLTLLLAQGRPPAAEVVEAISAPEGAVLRSVIKRVFDLKQLNRQRVREIVVSRSR